MSNTGNSTSLKRLILLNTYLKGSGLNRVYWRIMRVEKFGEGVC